MMKFEKKIRSKNWKGQPFPKEVAVGYFTGGDVEIFDQSHCKMLNDNGSFGLNPKPRQILMFNQQQGNKAMSVSEYQKRLEMKEKFGCDQDKEEDEPTRVQLDNGELLPDPFKISNSIVLYLEEAFFLCNFAGLLEIRDLNDEKVSTYELWCKFCKLKENFVECFVAYLFLKSRNWVIKPGLKFGGDFLLYKQSPSIYHASFVVIVQRSGSNKKAIEDVHTNVRISETTAKELLYLEVVFPNDVDSETYLANLEKFQVKETTVKRHEFN